MSDNTQPAAPPADHYLCATDPVALLSAARQCGLEPAPVGYQCKTVATPLGAAVLTRLCPTRSLTAPARYSRTAAVVYHDPTDRGVWVMAWPSLTGGGGDVAEIAGVDAWRFRRSLAEETVRRQVVAAAAFCFWTAVEAGYTLTPDGLALTFTLTDSADMTQATITFVIDKQGNVKQEVNGVTGTSCQSLTEPFTRALGEVQAEEMKPEYYQQAVEQTRVGAAS